MSRLKAAWEERSAELSPLVARSAAESVDCACIPDLKLILFCLATLGLARRAAAIK